MSGQKIIRWKVLIGVFMWRTTCRSNMDEAGVIAGRSCKY